MIKESAYIVVILEPGKDHVYQQEDKESALELRKAIIDSGMESTHDINNHYQ